jgi:hypothetical protein
VNNSSDNPEAAANLTAVIVGTADVDFFFHFGLPICFPMAIARP